MTDRYSGSLPPARRARKATAANADPPGYPVAMRHELHGQVVATDTCQSRAGPAKPDFFQSVCRQDADLR